MEQDFELQREARQAAKRAAIKSNPKYTLLEMLEERSVSKLKQMAKMHRVPRYSVMKKEELVSTLQESLQDSDRVKAILSVTEEAEPLLIALSKTKQVICEVDTCAQLGFCVATGFVQIYYFADTFTAVMPCEIQKQVKKVNTPQFREERERFDLIVQYARACVNLYGCIPLAEFIALFNAQNEQLLDENEVYETLLAYITEDSAFFLWDELLLSSFVALGDSSDVKAFLKITDGKPRYIPEKEELLKYSDDFYYAQTIYTERLKNYLQSVCKNEIQAENTMNEISFCALIGMGMGEVMEIMEDAEVIFRNRKDVENFTDIIMNLMNNTRQWLNKGYTPVERRESYVKKPQKNKKGTVIPFPILQSEVPQQAVHCNQFCPCGSGKKYKNCCGKYVQ